MQLSILVMIAGAIIAGVTDLTFSLPGLHLGGNLCSKYSSVPPAHQVLER